MTAIAPRSIRAGMTRRTLTTILAIFAVVSAVFVGVASTNAKTAKSFDVIQWVLCSWEDQDAKLPNGEKKYDNQPMLVHSVYQISQTDDLEANMFGKSAVSAEGTSALGAGDLANTLSMKDYSKPKLDILNTQNSTDKKYTPYDLFGFYTMKWTAYMGEWNYIKVYYCTSDNKGTGDDKEPSDQKLNLFYEGRKRPLDTWEQRYISQDPRVQLKQDTFVVPWTTNFMLNIANGVFYITKLIVAGSNALITLSLSDISAKFGINKVASEVMKNLLGGLFVPLVAMMMAFTGMWILIVGIAKHQTRKAMGGLARSLACMFGGFLFLANPGFFLSLPNQVSLIMEYLVLNGINNTTEVAGDSMCTTTSTAGFKGFDADFYVNGKFQTDAIQKGVEEAGDGIARAISCQYWRIFAFQPWVIGQYGTDYNNLWSKGHAPKGGKELGNMSDYPGSAAVDLGNKQTIYNWAIYQLSTQGMDHIASSLEDAKDGTIKEKPDPQLTDTSQYYSKNKTANQVNGDWYRVVDAVSGWDTDQDGESAGGSSSSGTGKGIDGALQWADKIAKDQTHGYDQAKRLGPDYDCSSYVSSALKAAGFNVNIFSTSNERAELEKAGFKKVEGANLRTGDGLLPGDVLWVENSSAQHTEFYTGNGKTLGAHENENGGTRGGKTGDQGTRYGEEIGYGKITDSPYMEAWRYGDGSSLTLGGDNSSSSGSSSGGVSISMKKDCDKAGIPGCADPTPYWNNWIGGNVAYRVWVALLSIFFAGVGLSAPIIMGGTVAALAVATSVIMMFAGVAFTFGMWQGKGEEVFKSWAAMVYSSVMKRVIMSVLYMVMLTFMLIIMKNLTNMTDYFKSCILLAIVSYVLVKSRHHIVDRFTQVSWGNDYRHINDKIGRTLVGTVKGARDIGASSVKGAALYYSSGRSGAASINGAKSGLDLLKYTAKGAGVGARTQIAHYMYQTDAGREFIRSRELIAQKQAKQRAVEEGNPDNPDYESSFVCFVCGKAVDPGEVIMSHPSIGLVCCAQDYLEARSRVEEERGVDWDTGQSVNPGRSRW